MLTLAIAVLLAAQPSIQADVLFVSNSFDNTITKFTPDGVGSVFANTGLQQPEGLAFDSLGNLFVANWSGNTIVKFTPDGMESVFANTGLNNPQALAFDSQGNLYVANWNISTIEKFTPDGVGSVFADAGLDHPQGMAFDSTGNLYAANWIGNTIEKFTPDGVGSVFANSGLNNPQGLAFDTQGNLYVANWNANTIGRFTPDGVGSVFANTPMSQPKGLAFDSQGNLYVANYLARTIMKFTPDGVGSVFANTGSSGPQFLTFQPAPKPTVANVTATNIGLTTATIGAQVTATGTSNQTATVTIYYDTADGGTNAGSWGHSISLGFQSGTAKTNLTGLTQHTLYYFRAFVTNSAGSSWASSSATFTTLQIVAPTVVNVAATNVGVTTATIGAQVTSAGTSNQTAAVSLYYGMADGGTNAGGWAHGSGLGLKSGTAALSLSGLTQATPYYFRAYVTNSAGSSWAPSTAAFTTLQIVPPTMANIAATGIAYTSATIGAQVIATGNQTPTVRIHYGTADGGTSAGSWAQSVSLGLKNGAATANVTGLTPNGLYYFRAYGTNNGGGSWAPATATFALLNSDIFTMGITPISTSVLAGVATNVTARVTVANLSFALSGTVTNSLMVIPADQGVTASLDTDLPYVAFGGGTSNLTLTVSASATVRPGVYQAVVAGTNASFGGNTPNPGMASVTYTLYVVTNLHPFSLRPFPLKASQRSTVACLESPSTSYDVYLPPAYSTNWPALPILYTLNPSGGGMVSDFQAVCAGLNIITIGLTGSANGVPWNTLLREMYAVTRDVRQRVLFDPTAEFVSGFSGGGETAYFFSRFLAQHVAGVLAMGAWLGRENNNPDGSVPYYSLDRVQTNLLVARTTGTSDTGALFYNPYDSNYLASCGAVIRDWFFSGGHATAPDSLKSAGLSWLLSRRIPTGPNDSPFDAVGQAANWRSRIVAGQSGTVLRECVATVMSQPRTWYALEAQLVLDELMTNYNAFRLLSVSNLAQGDFAADLFYYSALGAATNRDWQRYYGNLKALAGVTGTSGDRAGDIYHLLTTFKYPTPLLQMSAVQSTSQVNLWLQEDAPGLTYSLQSRTNLVRDAWQDISPPAVDADTIWSAAFGVAPALGGGFYRVRTAPVPGTSPPWPM